MTSRWVSTDDAARRLRDVWLGGKGFEWGFVARISAWVFAAFLFAGGCVISWVALPPLWFFVIGPVCSLVFAVQATRKVMPHVTHEVGMREHIQILRAELHAPRPEDEVTEYEVAISPDLFPEEHHA